MGNIQFKLSAKMVASPTQVRKGTTREGFLRTDLLASCNRSRSHARNLFRRVTLEAERQRIGFVRSCPEITGICRRLVNRVWVCLKIRPTPQTKVVLIWVSLLSNLRTEHQGVLRKEGATEFRKAWACLLLRVPFLVLIQREKMETNRFGGCPVSRTEPRPQGNRGIPVSRVENENGNQV